ncbi:MAG: TIR domain-containing protein [Clostridia bacterium]|nr:TIR domain-containing protein [Clostridia bacterium]
MSILKCKMCGGDLEVTEDMKIVECDYCGTKQTVPNADNEKKVNLFNRANRLRMASEFDKAAGIYENIIAEFPEEAEAYWGLCLCNYGIEYVDDPATAKKITTCHRASFESLQKDENFELALEYADVVAQKVYRDEAREIDRIMGEILAISKNEKPYDVFICYKETDDKGERTVDSVLAYDIYEALTAKGFNVFFARVTLEDKLGRQYEPYIFAALNSAKVMLSIGTKYEYFHAVWVKNEWSRFLKLMAKDKSKVLIPCFKDIDAYDMPDEFKGLQAQDLGKLGAVQDIVRGVEKLVGKNELSEHAEKVVVSHTGGPNVEALLKRGRMAIQDREWAKAKEYFEQVLNMNAECAEAYLGLAMSGEEVASVLAFVRKKDYLETTEQSFKKRLKNKNYQKAKQFADENLQKTLEKIEKDLEEEIKIEKNVKKRELEESKKVCSSLRKDFLRVKGLIQFGLNHVVGLKSDGTVVSVGENNSGQCNTENWYDIVDIATGAFHTVGLKSDGKVIAVGHNNKGECNIDSWSDIIEIGASSFHTIGLKSNGIVVAVGENDEGQCNIENWCDIVAISVGEDHTVGLKSDGTVVATGRNNYGQCNTERWSNIIGIVAGDDCTLGIKADGTVVIVGGKNTSYSSYNTYSWKDIVAVATGCSSAIGLKSDGTVVATNVQEKYSPDYWSNIVDIAAGTFHFVGLKSNGTVMSIGNREGGCCDTERWSDIVAIAADSDHTAGLKVDGTVVITGKKVTTIQKPLAKVYKYSNEYDLSDWKLFDDFNNLENERKIKMAEVKGKKLEEERRIAEEKRIAEEQVAVRRSQGLCQHCGGTFKGLFTKKCTNCGREKDY